MLYINGQITYLKWRYSTVAILCDDVPLHRSYTDLIYMIATRTSYLGAISMAIDYMLI